MWFEPKPFNIIHFTSKGKINNTLLIKRMKQALAGVSQILGDDYHLLPYNDRLGITVPFGWANEIQLDFQTNESKDNVVISIYPGNTKQQGYQIFNKSLDWQNKKTIIINGVEYEITIMNHIKLSHFNRYVDGLWFNDEQDVIKQLYSNHNFYNYSGKWTRDMWSKFEGFMDEHFKSEYKWREYCHWRDKFINSDRNYVTISFGYEVALYIPYSKFKDIDKTESDISTVSEFIIDATKAFQALINYDLH